MNTELCILPECYLDTNLLETIAPPTRGYNHQKGSGTVAKRMRERFHDSFAVGILDRDKQQIAYLEEFSLAIDAKRLRLYRHHEQQRGHFVITHPPIERWMCKNARETGVFLADYGLPEELSALMKIAKTVTAKRDVRFAKLFRDLKQRRAADIVRLAGWIAHLRDYDAQADIDVLRAL